MKCAIQKKLYCITAVFFFFCGFQEVVRTVIQGGGVKHLVTMATSEHMIMQNEALVALGLIAALDLGKSKNR